MISRSINAAVIDELVAARTIGLTLLPPIDDADELDGVRDTLSIDELEIVFKIRDGEPDRPSALEVAAAGGDDATG
jgi:hypothetical protein